MLVTEPSDGVLVSFDPVLEWHPVDTSASKVDPSSFRHFRLTLKINLKVMAGAVSRLRQPLVLTVRSRTVAKVISIGLAVRSPPLLNRRAPWPAKAPTTAAVPGAGGTDPKAPCRGSAETLAAAPGPRPRSCLRPEAEPLWRGLAAGWRDHADPIRLRAVRSWDHLHFAPTGDRI